MLPDWLRLGKRAYRRVGRPPAVVLLHLRPNAPRFLAETGRLFVFGYQVDPWPDGSPGRPGPEPDAAIRYIETWDADSGSFYVDLVRRELKDEGLLRSGGPDVVASYAHDYDRRRHVDYHVARAYWEILQKLRSGEYPMTLSVVAHFLRENLGNTILNIKRRENSIRQSAVRRRAITQERPATPEDVATAKQVATARAIVGLVVDDYTPETLRHRLPGVDEDDIKRAMRLLRSAREDSSEEE